jgi:anti-anti-sigma regulatory factor
VQNTASVSTVLGEVDTSLVGTGQLLVPLLSAARSVVVDLDGVEFLGSVGLLVLFGPNGFATANSAPLRLVCSGCDRTMGPLHRR